MPPKYNPLDDDDTCWPFSPGHLRAVHATCNGSLDMGAVLSYGLPAAAVPRVVTADAVAPFLGSASLFGALQENLDALWDLTSSGSNDIDLFGDSAPARNDMTDAEASTAATLAIAVERDWRQFVFFLASLKTAKAADIVAVMMFTHVDVTDVTAAFGHAAGSPRDLEAFLKTDGASVADAYADGTKAMTRAFCVKYLSLSVNSEFLNSARCAETVEWSRVAPTPYLRTVEASSVRAFAILEHPRLMARLGPLEATPAGATKSSFTTPRTVRFEIEPVADGSGGTAVAPATVAPSSAVSPALLRDADARQEGSLFALPTGVETLKGATVHAWAPYVSEVSMTGLARLPCLRSVAVDFSHLMAGKVRTHDKAAPCTNAEITAVALLLPKTTTDVSFATHASGGLSQTVIDHLLADCITDETKAAAADFLATHKVQETAAWIQSLRNSTEGTATGEAAVDAVAGLNASSTSAPTPLMESMVELYAGYDYMTPVPAKGLKRMLPCAPNLTSISLHSCGREDSPVDAADGVLSPSTVPRLAVLRLFGDGYRNARGLGLPSLFHDDYSPEAGRGRDGSAFECLTELQCNDPPRGSISIASVFAAAPKLTTLAVSSLFNVSPLGTDRSLSHRLTSLTLGDDHGTDDTMTLLLGGARFLLLLAAMHPSATKFSALFPLNLPTVPALVRCGLIPESTAVQFLGRTLWELASEQGDTAQGDATAEAARYENAKAALGGDLAPYHAMEEVGIGFNPSDDQQPALVEASGALVRYLFSAARSMVVANHSQAYAVGCSTMMPAVVRGVVGQSRLMGLLDELPGAHPVVAPFFPRLETMRFRSRTPEAVVSVWRCVAAVQSGLVDLRAAVESRHTRRRCVADGNCLFPALRRVDGPISPYSNAVDAEYDVLVGEWARDVVFSLVEEESEDDMYGSSYDTFAWEYEDYQA